MVFGPCQLLVAHAAVHWPLMAYVSLRPFDYWVWPWNAGILQLYNMKDGSIAVVHSTIFFIVSALPERRTTQHTHIKANILLHTHVFLLHTRRTIQTHILYYFDIHVFTSTWIFSSSYFREYRNLEYKTSIVNTVQYYEGKSQVQKGKIQL